MRSAGLGAFYGLQNTTLTKNRRHMKTGDIKQFLELHNGKGDIQRREINLTDEQIEAVEYLAKDQDVSFEDMAMTLIQYQLQLVEVQHREDIRRKSRLN